MNRSWWCRSSGPPQARGTRSCHPPRAQLPTQIPPSRSCDGARGHGLPCCEVDGGPRGPPAQSAVSQPDQRWHPVKIPLGDKSSLMGQASRALSWSFISNAGSRFGTLAIGLVLARRLGPHAFGTLAWALVALVAVLSFNELGVSLAIARWQRDPAEIAPTVTTLSLVASIVIYVSCFVGAPAFAPAIA